MELRLPHKKARRREPAGFQRVYVSASKGDSGTSAEISSNVQHSQKRSRCRGHAFGATAETGLRQAGCAGRISCAQRARRFSALVLPRMLSTFDSKETFWPSFSEPRPARSTALM